MLILITTYEIFLNTYQKNTLHAIPWTFPDNPLNNKFFYAGSTYKQINYWKKKTLQYP